MLRVLAALILVASLFGCSDTIQNSDKQKDMTQGSSPTNSTTATDQQNYGAATSDKTQQKSSQPTDNLTTPNPTTPDPQAGQATGSAQSQGQPRKESGTKK
ncbi:MAG TPA: hypothetical protein VN577_21055 [Terriglobales bacterium]|nr:hypothetical protein [Terriglobales bacterium]